MKGEYYGRITENSYGLAWYEPKIKANCFVELFDKWLTETLLGYEQRGFVYRVGGTVGENLACYETQAFSFVSLDSMASR